MTIGNFAFHAMSPPTTVSTGQMGRFWKAHLGHFSKAPKAWLRTIREKVQFRDMKEVEVTFPVISDSTMDVSRLYGMLQPSASTTQAVRGVFSIDPKGKVRAILYYPLSNGRNFQEIKRLLLAMQTTDTHKVATPADWQPGEEVSVPPPGVLRSREGARAIDGPLGSVPRLVPLFEELD